MRRNWLKSLLMVILLIGVSTTLLTGCGSEKEMSIEELKENPSFSMSILVVQNSEDKTYIAGSGRKGGISVGDTIYILDSYNNQKYKTKVLELYLSGEEESLQTIPEDETKRAFIIIEKPKDFVVTDSMMVVKK